MTSTTRLEPTQLAGWCDLDLWRVLRRIRSQRISQDRQGGWIDHVTVKSADIVASACGYDELEPADLRQLRHARLHFTISHQVTVSKIVAEQYPCAGLALRTEPAGVVPEITGCCVGTSKQKTRGVAAGLSGSQVGPGRIFRRLSPPITA